MNRKIVFYVTVAIGLVFSATAQMRSLYLGQPFFGARELALGGMVSGTDAASASFWNPASLPLSGGADVMFGRTHKFALRNWYEDSLSFSLPRWGRLRAGAFYWRDGVDLVEASQGQVLGNAWSTSLLGISGGVAFSPGFALGATIAQAGVLSRQDGESFRERTLLVNAGAALAAGNWRLGVTAKNIAAGGEMELEPDYGLGIAWEKEKKLRAQLELTSYLPPAAERRQLALGGGIEVQFRPELALRLGKAQSRAADDGGLTFGLGLGSGRLTIDYTFFNHSAGATHYLSTRAAF